VSPLHPLGEQLFSAHMAQHTILMVVAAPLLVLGRPLVPFVWALPRAWRRTLGRWAKMRGVRRGWRTLTDPFVAWALQGIAFWLWHAPRLYERALESEGVHALQHICFLGTALLFWWTLAHSRRRGMGHGMALLYVFTTLLYSGALGALLTFSTTLWIPAYAATTPAWGLTPLEDQQLAGLIMWVPAGLSYIGAALLLVLRWMQESEWRVTERERRALAGSRS
jgi:cytochrome c oxidase assembly factor CtaG